MDCYDLKKKYTFEDHCVEFLRRKIAALLSENDRKIRKKDNEKVMRFILRKISSKGFIRTHAFIMNWLRELFECGELTSKTFHEITDQLPWSWDQTKKYFDALEENKLISYARDSLGRKTCQLQIETSLKERGDVGGSPQIQKLVSFLTFRKKNAPTRTV